MSLTEGTIMGAHPHVRREEATDFGLAVASELARRHPVHTAKMIAQKLSALGPECTLRTAENILQGHLSARTLTRLTLAYGWDLMSDVIAAVAGKTMRDHIIEQSNAARRDAEEARKLESELTELAGCLAAAEAEASGLRGRLAQ